MRATAPSLPIHITAAAASDEIARLAIWRNAIVGSLWHAGRRNAPALRRELRRIERILCDRLWFRLEAPL